jgi:hypothetical protein
MIISMSLKKNRKCKLWVNETAGLPLANSENVIEKDIVSSINKSNDIVQMALELSLSRDSSYYALVGFECKSDNNQKYTKITVSMSKENLTYSSETLSASYDKVFTGISEEYGQSVLDSAVETINELGGLSSGEITFNVGAHAECGSSNAIFAQTTKLLLKLAKLDLLNMTEDKIQNEIESMFL